MAHFYYSNCKVILDKYDISGDLNSVTIARSQQDLSNDTFGSAANGFRARIPGLGDGVFGMAGLVELTDNGQDEIFNSKMSVSNVPILVTLRGATEFDRCKFGVIQHGQYQSGGNVGGRAEFSAEGRISGYTLTDGNILAVGAKTGTFNGTPRGLGSMTGTQTLYASLHATAKTSFTSAVFKVQSDVDADFASPTDRITFTTVSDLTSEFKAVSTDPLNIPSYWTDQYFRVICDSFTGTSLTVYIAVGFQ